MLLRQSDAKAALASLLGAYRENRDLLMALASLQQDAPQAGPGDLLHAVLLDSRHGRYPGGIEWKELERRGIEVVDREMVCPDDPQHHDPERTSVALLELVEELRARERAPEAGTAAFLEEDA